MDNSAKKMYFPQAVFPMMEDGIAGEKLFFSSRHSTVFSGKSVIFMYQDRCA